MSCTIWIDPGYSKTGKGCACALFRPDSKRVWRVCTAWFMRPEDFSVAQNGLPDVDKVTYELPQQDKRSRSTPHEVLIKLTAAGASLAGLYAGFAGAELDAKTPSQWKGSLEKPPHHADIWDKLSPNERNMLGGDATKKEIDKACRKGGLDNWRRPGAEYYPKTWLTHNLLDAVGMGVVGHKR